MLFAYSDLLRVDATAFFVFFGAVIVALLVGIAFHEFCHALAADALGDPTPRSHGRLTLNPLAHLDPLGSVVLLFAGFGWGKPVPVNPFRLRRGVRGWAVVAAAGPLSNLALAVAAAAPIKAGLVPAHHPFDIVFNRATWDGGDYLGLFLTSVVFFGAILAVFNLLPIAPLDGFRVAVGILPRELGRQLAQTEPYGPVLLIALFALPIFTGVSLLWFVLGPVSDFIVTTLLGGR